MARLTLNERETDNAWCHSGQGLCVHVNPINDDPPSPTRLLLLLALACLLGGLAAAEEHGIAVHTIHSSQSAPSRLVLPLLRRSGK
jgi:hypothetical protein